MCAQEHFNGSKLTNENEWNWSSCDCHGCMCVSVSSIIRIKILALFTLDKLLLLTVFHRDDALDDARRSTQKRSVMPKHTIWFGEFIRSTLHNDTHGSEAIAAAVVRSTSLMLTHTHKRARTLKKSIHRGDFSMNRAFVWSIDQHTSALHSSHWMQHTLTHHSNHYYYYYHPKYKCPSFQFWIESEISSIGFYLVRLSFQSQLHRNSFDWIKIYHYFSEWVRERKRIQ